MMKSIMQATCDRLLKWSRAAWLASLRVLEDEDARGHVLVSVWLPTQSVTARVFTGSVASSSAARFRRRQQQGNHSVVDSGAGRKCKLTVQTKYCLEDGDMYRQLPSLKDPMVTASTSFTVHVVVRLLENLTRGECVKLSFNPQ